MLYIIDDEVLNVEFANTLAKARAIAKEMKKEHPERNIYISKEMSEDGSMGDEVVEQL